SEESGSDAGHDGEAAEGASNATDVGSESDVESFMRGGRRGRRTPREPAGPQDPASAQHPEAAQFPGAAQYSDAAQHSGTPEVGAAGSTSGGWAGDPDSTATRPIDTSGPPAGSPGGD